MKFLCERDVLKDALAHVIGRAKGGLAIPILTHVLLEAGESELTLTGHDLDSCSRISIPAEVSAPGAAAVPGERFNRLVQGCNEGSQVTVETDKQATVKSGRSQYRLPLLPADDFPNLLAPSEGRKITLPGADLVRLLEMPTACATKDMTRPYFAGAFVHSVNGKIAAAGSNGIEFVKVDGKQDADIPGAIIPMSACNEFLKFSDLESELEIGKNAASIRSGKRYFATKLIDAIFPDYPKFIPTVEVEPVTFDTATLQAALARIEAVMDDSKGAALPVIKLEWDEDPESVSVSMNGVGAGAEQVECEAHGCAAGEIAFNFRFFRGFLQHMNAERLSFHFNGPAETVRVTDPLASDLVALVFPYRV